MLYIGTIQSVSNAPSLPSGSNWMLVGCNAEALANGKWRITREYRASGRGGWNKDIYAS
jgi:hypothetical protein